MSATIAVMDDPLKGLLRDKGLSEANRHIRIVQRKILRIAKAMEALVEEQRVGAKAAGSDCMDLYLATSPGPSIGLGDKKGSYVIEWRAKAQFAQLYNLGPSSRLHPFDGTHETHKMVYEYVHTTTPGYYKVLASFETARLTLNCALKALRKVAVDLNKIRAETEGLPAGVFDRDAAKLSRRLISEVDPSGEVAWIIQGLYFQV